MKADRLRSRLSPFLRHLALVGSIFSFSFPCGGFLRFHLYTLDRELDGRT